MKISYSMLSFDPIEIITPWSSKHLGVDVKTDDVCTMCNGVVVSVLKDGDGLFGVTIQYDGEHLFRYMHLKDINVELNDALQMRYRIGHAHKYVHVELLSRSTGDKHFPVRIGSNTFYKQDPTKYIKNELRME